MFLIADLLERAKRGAGIESDYRLAKVIGISHGAMTHYRQGRTLPNEAVIEQLCALSGDDPGVIAAQIQAARSKSPEAVNMWLMIAQRLSSDRRQTVRAVSTAILSVLFSIVLIATPSSPASAAGLDYLKAVSLKCLYIVSTTILSGCVLLHSVRLRWRQGLPFTSWLRAGALWVY